MIYEDITDQQILENDHGGDAAEVQEPKLEPEIILHSLMGWTNTENHACNRKNRSLQSNGFN